MTKPEIGLILANARRRSGKTQAELAQVMGTTQPVIARAEAGYRMPTLDFIDRWARGTGVPIVLKLGQSRPGMPAAATRRALVRSVLGPGRFNPWDRNPAPVEAALLEQAGLSRKHFERMKRQREGSGDDIERTVTVKIGGVSIRMISCEDLYLDRIRQATVAWPREDVSFDSAFEIALTNYATMDWDYVRAKLRATASTERGVGTLMVSVNRRVRSRARRGSAGIPSAPV